MEKNRRYIKGKGGQLQKVLLWEIKRRMNEDLSRIMAQCEMKHLNITHFPCNYIILTKNQYQLVALYSATSWY